MAEPSSRVTGVGGDGDNTNPERFNAVSTLRSYLESKAELKVSGE